MHTCTPFAFNLPLPQVLARSLAGLPESTSPFMKWDFLEISSLLWKKSWANVSDKNARDWEINYTILRCAFWRHRNENISMYQVSLNFVQLPAIVPNGVVDAPVAVDVLLHRGQVHAPGHHVHLRLPRERACPSFLNLSIRLTLAPGIRGQRTKGHP